MWTTEIRPHNRAAIQSHFLFPYITLIEGSSIDPNIVSQAGKTVQPGNSDEKQCSTPATPKVTF